MHNKGSKIIITVGGTGGHVFPAMALGQQLKDFSSNIEILFVGADLSKNPFFNKSLFSFKESNAAHFNFRNPLSIGKSFKNILSGVFKSRQIIKSFRPTVVVGFGSFHTFPTLIAAKSIGIPIVLHEANSFPGRVNRLLSPFVASTGIQFPMAKKWLKGKTEVIGLPLREGYKYNSISKEEARHYFHLDKDRFTILVFGGSQGSLGINKLFTDGMTSLVKRLKMPFQVLHFTGEKEPLNPIRNHYKNHGINAVVIHFESKMEMAWQAADLLISRSGAATIAEQLEMEIPGILIPFPHATDKHQNYNADFMVNVGGAIRKDECELAAESLAELIYDLCQNTEKLKTMQNAIHFYKIHRNQRDLRALVCEVGGIEA